MNIRFLSRLFAPPKKLGERARDRAILANCKFQNSPDIWFVSANIVWRQPVARKEEEEVSECVLRECSPLLGRHCLRATTISAGILRARADQPNSRRAAPAVFLMYLGSGRSAAIQRRSARADGGPRRAEHKQMSNTLEPASRAPAEPRTILVGDY